MGNNIIIEGMHFQRSREGDEECIFEDVSLSFVDESGIVLLFGPSGTGKSTLLYLLCGLLKPTRGIITVNDYRLSDPVSSRLHYRYRAFECTILFQNYPLVEWLTASENAKLFATEPEKAEECLAKLGLTKQRNRYVNKLSFGQRQRVAIAQTLLSNNRILLMDEPTSAVDQDNKISVMELIQASAQEQQRLILIATHDPELIDFADWMVNVNRYELEKRKVR